MKNQLIFIRKLFLIMITSMSIPYMSSAQLQKAAHGKYILAIHGGAGTILKKNMTPEKEQMLTDALRQSLMAGYGALKSGSNSLDAVQAAIRVMEDSPLFNAGKGAVFTHEGTNEMDASIMAGFSKAAGAVAGVKTVKNPINAARAVMEKSGHVMLAGAGADAFAKQAGLEIVSPEYFYTQERWDALQRQLKKDSANTSLDHDDKQSFVPTKRTNDEKFGTVGAVALDRAGHLSAGTSTGGMTNKKFGRVGDSPIIGAGTYANEQVAVSSTGWGEYYIRSVAAYDVAALVAYKKLSISQAGNDVIRKIGLMGGNGGMIILDSRGNIAMPFNTEGMYRGAITDQGEIEIYFYK